jgi:hypothetical protein
LDAFQQTAFEGPAILRPAGINPAKGAVETGAGLWKSRLTGFLPQRQPKFCEPPGIVALLQSHVGEQDAVATQAALRAKLCDKVI